MEFGLLITSLGNLSHGGSPPSPELVDFLCAHGPGRRGHFRRPAVHDYRALCRGWADLLAQVPLDEEAFYRLSPETVRENLVSGLTAWCVDFRRAAPDYQARHEPVFVFASIFLLTWLGMRESKFNRTTATAGKGYRSYDASGHDCQVCRALVRDPAVQAGIREVYRPPAAPGASRSREELEWEALDFSSLALYRHGTTSLVMRCRRGRNEFAAVKLVLLPFSRIPTIAAATRDYRRDFNPADVAQASLVDVWASTERWIMMQFVSGVTLVEVLNRPALLRRLCEQPHRGLARTLRDLIAESDQPDEPDEPAPSAGATLDELLRGYDRRYPPPAVGVAGDSLALDTESLRVFGGALFEALDELDQRSTDMTRPAIHGDLTPSNIIVTDGPTIAFVLVDMGRNYLYSQSVTGVMGLESRYIAPEAREGRPLARSSDVYSVGQILIDLGGFFRRSNALVPDAFYARTPLLARFLEDVIQEQPAQRLLLLRGPASADPVNYGQLQRVFADEIEAVSFADRERTAFRDGDVLDVIGDLLRPTAKAPRRQWRLWRVRRRQWSQRRGLRGGHVQWLSLCSLLSATICALTAAAVITWTLRDLKMGWGGIGIDLLHQYGHVSSDQFPVLDLLRRPGYQIPDLRDNWQARLIGFSYVLIGLRYYQGIFAGVTPLLGWPARSLRPHVLAAETAIRVMTVVPALLVLSVTLVESWWWPISSAIGQTFVFLANCCSILFARKALRQARELGISSVAADDQQVSGLASFAAWAPSSFFYAVVVWVFGLLIYLRFLKDPVYAIAVASVNIGLLYLVKCGTNAAPVRIALTRACLAAERVALVETARAEEQRPPASPPSAAPLPGARAGAAVDVSAP